VTLCFYIDWQQQKLSKIHSIVLQPFVFEDLDNRECLKDNRGVDYIGTKAISLSGTSCTTWTAWHVTLTDSQFPYDRSVREAKNYCRYLDNTPPWCFIADNVKTKPYWETCNISLCCK